MADIGYSKITEGKKSKSEEAENVIPEGENKINGASNRMSTKVSSENNEGESAMITEEVTNNFTERKKSNVESIISKSDKSSEHNKEHERFRKLFIGGLSFSSTEETMKSHFEQWGEIVDCVVVKDSNTKKSKGYGFVTYKKPHMADDAQAARPHKIDGRKVDTKRAVPREISGKPDGQITSKKLYVARLKDDIKEQDLREYFGKYGKIVNVNIVTDKSTGKKKGFAFIEFNDHDPVDKILLIRQHSLKGVTVLVHKGFQKQERQTSNRSSKEARGNGRANDYGRSHEVSSPWVSGVAPLYVGSNYQTSALTAGNLGAGYGYSSGGGPVRNNGHSQRSRDPYGRGYLA